MSRLSTTVHPHTRRHGRPRPPGLPHLPLTFKAPGLPNRYLVYSPQPCSPSARGLPGQFKLKSLRLVPSA